jgi:hydroxymethylbilane synthase
LLARPIPRSTSEIVRIQETRGDEDQTSKLLRHGGKVAPSSPRSAKPCAAENCRRCIREGRPRQRRPGLIIAATLPRDLVTRGARGRAFRSMRFALPKGQRP